MQQQQMNGGSGQMPPAGQMMANGGPKSGLRLEYFDLHGRACQIRMCLWYTGVPYEDCRLTTEEHAKKKAAGDYIFGSLPALFYPNGVQIQQAMSILRMISAANRGRMGEKMYPGKMNPEQCHHIDNMLELASDELANMGFYLNPAAVEEGYAKYKVEKLPKFLEAIEKRLTENVDPRFLVGYGLTAADCAIGAFALR